MDKPPENDSLRALILVEMREKDTQELFRIWRKNDHEAWTDIALELTRQVLTERLGGPPEQFEDEFMEDAPDEENPGARDHLYTPEEQKILKIADACDLASYLIAAVTVLFAIYNLVFSFVRFIDLYGSIFAQATTLISAIITFLSTILSAGFFFLVLQGINQVIYLLLDIKAHVEPEGK
jgi:hypothetical protein